MEEEEEGKLVVVVELCIGRRSGRFGMKSCLSIPALVIGNLALMRLKYSVIICHYSCGGNLG